MTRLATAELLSLAPAELLRQLNAHGWKILSSPCSLGAYLGLPSTITRAILDFLTERAVLVKTRFSDLTRPTGGVDPEIDRQPIYRIAASLDSGVDDSALRQYVESVLLSVYRICKDRHRGVSLLFNNTFTQNREVAQKNLLDIRTKAMLLLNEKYDGDIDRLEAALNDQQGEIQDALLPYSQGMGSNSASHMQVLFNDLVDKLLLEVANLSTAGEPEHQTAATLMYRTNSLARQLYDHLEIRNAGLAGKFARKASDSVLKKTAAIRFQENPELKEAISHTLTQLRTLPELS